MELLVNGVSHFVSFIYNFFQDLGMDSLHVFQESYLERLDLIHVNAVTVSFHSNEERGNNVFWFIRFVLSLLQKFVQSDTTVQLLLGCWVKIGTEFGESSNLTVLGEFELHGTSNSLGSLVLSGGTDTGHRKTDGNCWTLTLVEKFGFQEDLSVCNRNHIGRNVSGHITGLGFNHWKGSEGSSTVTAVHLSSTFEKTRMQIKHITRVSFTTWRTTKKKRHLTVCNSLLGKIIVENHSVLSRITEVFSHGSSSVWGKELQRSRVGSSSRNNDTIVHGLSFFELSHKLCNC
mmetsp:Transcript_33747/g.51760  ORF Transcript_33747/g.51760 Transcript_33747/m.51760 type:complete len:289 (-) Transcript_33747:301-1167(-)